jgi:hypothetical protein
MNWASRCWQMIVVVMFVHGACSDTQETSTSAVASTSASSSASSSTAASTSTASSSGSGGSGGGQNSLPPALCNPPAESPSAGACVTLGGKIECNPITQEPCDVAAGEACDTNLLVDGFACYPTGNVHAVCEACSQVLQFCQPGLTCPELVAEGSQAEGQCAKYCCDDNDCGPSGMCYTALLRSHGLPAGHCVVANGAGGSGGM